MSNLRTVLVVAAFVVLSVQVFLGQTRDVTISVKDPRPIAAAALRIEQLSGVPINYEDPLLLNSADLRDVTDEVISSAQKDKIDSAVRVVGARGGELTQTFSFSENSTPLERTETAFSAVSGFILAEQSAFNQRFVVKRGNGVLYVAPAEIRDASGVLKNVVPVFAAKVSFPLQSRNAFATLKLILKLTSDASGFQIAPGTMPIRPFAESEITMGAQDEPAKDVIARLLQLVTSGNGTLVPYSAPEMSYALLSDPGLGAYAVNFHFVSSTIAPGPPDSRIVPDNQSNGFFDKVKP